MAQKPIMYCPDLVIKKLKFYTMSRDKKKPHDPNSGKKVSAYQADKSATVKSADAPPKKKSK